MIVIASTMGLSKRMSILPMDVFSMDLLSA
jgi:hypothetical protein